MSDIVFYSIHCPQCNVLKNKMDDKNIKYKEVNDTDIMQNKGIMSSPVLEIDGIRYDFAKAVKYINEI